MGALENLKTIDIRPWLRGAQPMAIPTEFATVDAAAPLPADRRGTHHSAARLDKIRDFVRTGKFRRAEDVQKASPNMLGFVQSRVREFLSAPVAPPTLASGDGDAFVSAKSGQQLSCAAWAHRIELPGVDLAAVEQRLIAWFDALAASDVWDMSKRGTGSGSYAFSQHKEAAHIAVAFGFARYFLSAPTRRAVQERLLRCAWHAVGQWSDGRVGRWFPNRQVGEYAKGMETGFFDYSYGAGNPFRYFWLGADQRTQRPVWQVPRIASSFGNQWGDAIACAGLAAALNPQCPELLGHVKRAQYEQLTFGCHGPTGLPAEIGARADDYGYPGQGLTYGSVLANGAMLAAASAAVCLGDRDMLDFETSDGAMGSAGGPKSLRRMIQSIIDLRSGKLPMQSCDQTGTLGTNPLVPRDDSRSYTITNAKGKEKVHELTMVQWAEFFPSLNVADFYRRRGDFAGKPLPGTSGLELDSGNVYGKEYVSYLPVDPAIFLSFQDVLLSSAVTPAEPPAPSPAPAPVTPQEPEKMQPSDFTMRAKAETAAGTEIVVHLTPGRSKCLVTGTVSGELIFKAQEGEKGGDVNLGRVTGPQWAVEVPSGTAGGVRRAYVGSVQTAKFTLSSTFGVIDAVSAKADGSVQANVGLWGLTITGATVAGRPMTVTGFDAAATTLQRPILVASGVPAGDQTVTVKFSNGATATKTVTVPAAAPAPVPAPAPPAPEQVTITVPKAAFDEVRALVEEWAQLEAQEKAIDARRVQVQARINALVGD